MSDPLPYEDMSTLRDMRISMQWGSVEPKGSCTLLLFLRATGYSIMEL